MLRFAFAAAAASLWCAPVAGSLVVELHGTAQWNPSFNRNPAEALAYYGQAVTFSTRYELVTSEFLLDVNRDIAANYYGVTTSFIVNGEELIAPEFDFRQGVAFVLLRLGEGVEQSGIGSIVANDEFVRAGLTMQYRFPTRRGDDSLTIDRDLFTIGSPTFLNLSLALSADGFAGYIPTITSASFSGDEPYVDRSQPTGVPEPATWAMMIGGLGLIGVALRARRQPHPA